METHGLHKVTILLEQASYLTDTGSADTYVVAFNPAITAYTNGLRVRFKALNANTTTSTLSVNGLTAITIKKNVTTNLAANDILANQIVEVTYDGTNFQVLSGGGGGDSGYSGYSSTSGFSGYSSTSGFSGYTGFSGYSGTGLSGFSGYSGTGISGFSGYTGFSGYSATGTSGFSGYSGTGTSGFSGYSGIGTSGFSGYSGIGTSGFSGYSGTNGTTGTSGFSGYSGTGASGFSGYSGAGSSGFSGYTGYSGYSSTSGFSGYSGAAPTGQIILTAGGGWPSTTNGSAEPVKINFASNGIDTYLADFDPSTAEYMQWTLAMPSDYNGGTFTAVFYWLANSASTNAAIWGVAARSYGDNEAIDQAWGTAQVVTDANQGTNILNITSATSAVTPSGTPTASELMQFRVYRDAAAGGDTLTVDARLITVRISYTRV